MQWHLCVLAIGLSLASSSARVTFEGNEVWRLTAGSSERDRANLHALVEKLGSRGDVWAQSKSWVDIMVEPHQSQYLQKVLSKFHIDHQLMIADVQKLVNEEDMRRASQPKAFSLEHYNSFEDIESYLTSLAADNDNAELMSIGKSVEGRDLWMVKVSSGSGKQGIWIDCGIHAREWIGPATCLYGLDNIVKGSSADFTSLLDAYDLYIMPVNNPDGYVYTHEHNRMWRKNRNHYPDDSCAGIDLNRNFDDHWGGLGTSGNSCSETYRGPSATSEPEIAATQGKIDELASNLQALYSIHSYSQLWMYAFGYDYVIPDENADLEAASIVGVNALSAVHGTNYDYGPIASTIYPAAGTTVDYGYSAGIVHSYTLELRDTGSWGFLLPESQITPTGEETWAGLIASILSM